MRLKELRGLPVIDPTAARKIGTVQDYQVDPVSGRLAALDINGVENGDGERILAARIRRVGSSAVILTPRGGVTPGTPLEVNERWLDASTLQGLEVMGDDGNLVGHLVDASFDQDSLEVNAYLLRSGGFDQLLGRRGRIAPAKVHSCSRELMIFATGRLSELAAATPVVEETPSPTLSLRMPLKAEDRLPEPSYDKEPEAQPVGAPSLRTAAR
jgi:sporulation protein YlmC with PRC-barrel domain